jgi:hypothetical protein
MVVGPSREQGFEWQSNYDALPLFCPKLFKVEALTHKA